MSIKDTIKDKINSFVESKKQEALKGLEGSSVGVLLTRFVLLHWVTILLVGVLSIFMVRSYLKTEELSRQLLTSQLAALNVDLQKMKEERAALLARVNELGALKTSAAKENQKVRKDASNLTADQKKQKILEYKNRLMNKGVVK